MKKLITICLVVTMILVVSSVAQATIFNYDVSPGDLADGPTFLNGRGGEKFGYDPDSVKPIGSSQTGPAGFGDSCFWADVQGSAAGGGVDYTAIRLSPRDIFGVSDITISELFEISYYTKWNSDFDWQIKIYTEDVTPTVEWYQTRIEWNRPSPVDNNWNQYTTDGLKIGKLTLKVGGDQTIPGTGLLSDLDTVYGTEKILFIDIISSYMTASPPGDSYLDGISIQLDNGDIATMNLVPEPATMVLLGLGGLLLRRKRKA